MSKVAIAVRRISSLPRGFRVGLREQLALLGISGVIVTGAICAFALLYGSVAQRESNANNEFKNQVVLLSQTFLESGQIASKFERKPSEEAINRHTDNHERQLAALSRVEAFVTDVPDDSPMKEATSRRSTIKSLCNALPERGIGATDPRLQRGRISRQLAKIGTCC